MSFGLMPDAGSVVTVLATGPVSWWRSSSPASRAPHRRAGAATRTRPGTCVPADQRHRGGAAGDVDEQDGGGGEQDRAEHGRGGRSRSSRFESLRSLRRRKGGWRGRTAHRAGHPGGARPVQVWWCHEERRARRPGVGRDTRVGDPVLVSCLENPNGLFAGHRGPWLRCFSSKGRCHDCAVVPRRDPRWPREEHLGLPEHETSGRDGGGGRASRCCGLWGCPSCCCHRSSCSHRSC